MTDPFPMSTCSARPSAVGRAGTARNLAWLLAPLFLTACNGGAPGSNAAVSPAASEGGNSRAILCGPQGAELRPDCLLEASERDGTLHLILRQPDGGFRRLIWPRGGTLSAADGAEPLTSVPLDDGVEARIGQWRYRIETGGQAK